MKKENVNVNEFLKLNIQFFAEDAGDGADAGNNPAEDDAQEKTYSQADIDELFKKWSSETDRRVSEAVKTNTKKYEKQLSLSKLDGDEREKAEKDNKIAELEEKLAAFTIEKNKSELKSVLSSRGLSAEFADIIVINDDIEASQANIEKLDKLFKAAVTAEIEKRLAAGATPKGNGSGSAEITKETAKKMSLAEMNELASKDPDKFKNLFN
jgi:hypothetical protein